VQKYLGWIPTITGHLSFSTIGTGKNPAKTFKFLRSYGNKTLSIVAQERRTTDVPFKMLGGDYLNSRRLREGSSVFVLFAETNEQNDFSELTGPCVELTKEAYESFKGQLQGICEELDPTHQERLFRSAAQSFLEEAAVRPGSFSAVKILRNGRTEISFVADDRIDEVAEGRNASQVFFFLRDITHRHYHHAESSDTILDVVPEESGEDGWKRETLYSLYRWVIHRKRDQSPEQLINCKGVLAYAKAFEEAHCSEGGKRPAKKYPKYNHDTTLASVEARLEAIRHSEKSPSFATQFFSKGIPLFTVFLAIVAPLYSNDLPQDPSPQQQIVAAGVAWLNRYIIAVIGCLLMVSLVASTSARVKSGFPFASFAYDFWHDLLRAALAVFSNRASAVIVLLILMLGLTGIAISLGASLVDPSPVMWFGPGQV
jgi:hypothetical protein